MDYQITYTGVSHIGNYRKVNQDNLLCGNRYMEADNQGTGTIWSGSYRGVSFPWLGVFDGMGGEENGEMAAYLSVQTAYELQEERIRVWNRLKDFFLGNYIEDKLKVFCRKANERICNYTVENQLQSVGTTAAVLVFTPRCVYLCNVGDSKIFRFRAGKLQQLSKDHLIDVPYRKKPVLYQNLGIMESEMIIEPYLRKEKLVENDLYLICSDGLTDMVTVNEIECTLMNSSLDIATHGLLNQALVRGGKDNITLILCKVNKAEGTRGDKK